MSEYCETAQVSLSTDELGRHWEHFYLEQNYIFSNQIPNRQSFTTTNPGEVIYQRALCRWRTQPSAPINAAQTAPAMAPGEGGAMGLLLLIGIIGSGIYAWYTKVKPDWSDDYHPMADVPPLPSVYVERFDRMPGHAQGDRMTPPPYGPSPPVADSRRPSQASVAGGFSAPWDDAENVGDDDAEAVIDDNLTVINDGSPYGLDKLRGVSLKQFKEQLNRHGITPESGCFKSVELLQYPGASLFVVPILARF